MTIPAHILAALEIAHFRHSYLTYLDEPIASALQTLADGAENIVETHQRFSSALSYLELLTEAMDNVLLHATDMPTSDLISRRKLVEESRKFLENGK